MSDDEAIQRGAERKSAALWHLTRENGAGAAIWAASPRGAHGDPARVAVPPDSWTAFRQAAIAEGVSAAPYLGRLVEAEVRRRAREVARVSVERAEPDQAFAALAEVRASIDELDHIAGRLARAATAHGGTWADVGSSLRLRADAAGIRVAALRNRPRARIVSGSRMPVDFSQQHSSLA